MSTNLITVDQLQEAAQRSYQASGEVAAAAAAVVQELLELLKADKATWTSYTLTTGGWVTNTEADTLEVYPYCYHLAVSDATAADSADVVFEVSSQETVCSAGICPTHYVGDGIITFYAQEIPTDAISLQLCLIISATEEETT